nr:glycosyltransferase family 2 protein [Desulfobulbaceae bacterium]
MSRTKIPLSIAIITFNEEERLADCLKSIAFVDDVVVVDSGSTDNTVAIAASYGAKVFQEEWQGFGIQKQIAIDRCRNKWVLVLDADERVSPESAIEIQHILDNPGSNNAYKVPRKNIFLNRWIQHAGWWPDHVVRLINTKFCKMNSKPVHESIIVEGSTGTLQNPLIHYATRDIKHTLAKIDRYSSIGAAELFENGEMASYNKALARGTWAFLYNYLFRMGFRDGSPGFIIAVSDAINKFFKYAKLVELSNTHKKTDSFPS